MTPVIELGEKLLEIRGILQRLDRILHQYHAVHQDSKADHDGTDVLLSRIRSALCHHQDGADKRKDQREILRIEEGQPQGTFRIDTHQTQEPCGKGLTDIGADDNDNGLGDFHDAAVDKSHQHDRQGRGGLEDDGDAGTQQETEPPVGGEFLERLFHFTASHLFKTGGHDAHAIQEERQTANDHNDGKDNVFDIHTKIPPF